MTLDSNNISEIYSSETAVVGGALSISNNTSLVLKGELSLIHQLRMPEGEESKSKEENAKEIVQKGKKLVLKDNSILLDLSKIGDTPYS